MVECGRSQTRSEILQAAPQPPVRVIETIQSLSVSEPVPGSFVFDLGQNMVGVVQLTVTEPEGTELTIRQGEMLIPDKKTVYVENLRSARATDIYICKGVPAKHGHLGSLSRVPVCADRRPD